jgi:hypothetical protein
MGWLLLAVWTSLASPAAAGRPGLDPSGLCPALNPVPELRARLMGLFERGAPIDSAVQQVAFCREVAANLGAAPSPSRTLEINYLQNLEALLHDARFAAYVQKGRPRDVDERGFQELVRLAHGELSRGNAPPRPDLVATYAARQSPPDDIAGLRTRLALLRLLEDDPRNPFNRYELAALIQPAQFTLAGLEDAARRRGETVEQSRVGDSNNNYVGPRPVTNELLDWHQVYRYLDVASATRLADALVAGSVSELGAVHSCYASFKRALEVVLPDIRSVAPIGGADDWYLYYNTRAEYLGHARLRRVDPATIDWSSPRSVESTGRVGLVLSYNAACPQTWLSEQTRLSGHIEAIVPDAAPLPAGSPRRDFRVCAEKCRALTVAKIEQLKSATADGAPCLSVMAFVADAPMPMRDEQVVDVEPGSGYDAERAIPRRERLSRAQKRMDDLGKLSPLEFLNVAP